MTASVKLFVETAIHNSFFIDRLDLADLAMDHPYRLSYHRLLLIENGSGRLLVDETNFSLAGQELFLLAKGQVFFFDNPSVVTGYVLSFGDCFWEKTPASASNCKAVLFNNAAVNQHLNLSTAELAELCLLFRTLLTEFRKVPYTNQIDALAAYLKIIMIKVANVKLTDETAVDSQDYVLYRAFLDVLSVNYKVYREVGDYASRLGITARRLSEICKRCSQKSAKELINGQLVAEAKRLLQFSSSPIKEIAYQLSFNSPEAFSHFFKKHTTYSPTTYRDYFVHLGHP